MALGAGETTPFRLTAAYSAFANGGRRIEPHLIEEVQRPRRQARVPRRQARLPPLRRRPTPAQDSPRIPPAGDAGDGPDHRLRHHADAAGRGAERHGAAVGAASGDPLAGKTGTTNDYRSAWFVGYSPDLVVGIFVGFDDNRSLGDGETGAVAAVPIFIDFMREALKGQPKTDFKAPKDTRFIDVNGHREAFRPGQEPDPGPAAPRPGDGPVPYDKLPSDLNGLKPGQTGAPTPAAAAAPPPPKKATDDLKGLY